MIIYIFNIFTKWIENEDENKYMNLILFLLLLLNPNEESYCSFQVLLWVLSYLLPKKKKFPKKISKEFHHIYSKNVLTKNFKILI
jgi:hypothetical protein